MALIDDVQGNYQPRISAIVDKLNQGFTQHFQDIKCEGVWPVVGNIGHGESLTLRMCTGEVTLHAPEDFSQWELRISVSYREGVVMKQLSGTSQSGGVRCVQNTKRSFFVSSSSSSICCGCWLFAVVRNDQLPQ